MLILISSFIQQKLTGLHNKIFALIVIFFVKSMKINKYLKICSVILYNYEFLSYNSNIQYH